MNRPFKKIREIIALIFILSIGVFFRFYNLNWDQNQHLHPDERFLTTVATALKLPTSFSQYINPSGSTFSPYNIGSPFFVYGSLPLYLTKIIAVIIHSDNYNIDTLIGRGLSALFDIGTIFLVYLLSQSIFKKLNKQHELYQSGEIFSFIATFLYSLNVFAIQQSHFFTVDAALTFFITLSVYFVLKGIEQTSISSNYLILLASIIMGFAIGSKIIALFFIPFMFLYIIFNKTVFGVQKNNRIRIERFLNATALCLIFIISIYFIFRLIQPFYFADGNFLHLKINPHTLQNFSELSAMDNPATTFPPAIQWQSKTKIVWPLEQLFLYGITPLLTLCAILGIAKIIFLLIKSMLNTLTNKASVIILNFVIQYRQILFISLISLSYFIFEGIRFTMNMRYFYPIYPYLIIIGVYFVSTIPNKSLIKLLIVSLCTIQAVWAIAFLSVYSHPHSRLMASRWIYENIPEKSTTAYEHWDDPVPLNFEAHNGSVYQYQTLQVFIPDGNEKWDTILTSLTKSDYYTLSSNRAWGSIPHFAKRFPQSAVFYEKLLNGDLGLEKIAEFKSRPTIGPIEFNDDYAEESFTVYDHPIVLIYKVVDREKLREQINLIKSIPL